MTIERPAGGLGIRQDVADLRRYLIELRTLLFDQAAKAEGGTHQKVSGSPAPWNSTIGDLLMDVHAGARQFADALDVQLGQMRQPRGGADAGTMKALDRVAQRVAQVRRTYLDERLADAAERALSGWALRCRQELDQLRDGEEPWSRAPGGLRCPNYFQDDRPEAGLCNAELWLAPGWAHDPAPAIYCRATCCRDEDGRPYCWPFDVWRPLVA